MRISTIVGHTLYLVSHKPNKCIRNNGNFSELSSKGSKPYLNLHYLNRLIHARVAPDQSPTSGICLTGADRLQCCCDVGGCWGAPAGCYGISRVEGDRAR